MPSDATSMAAAVALNEHCDCGDPHADGKRQVDDLTKRADDLVAKKEYAKAEVSLGIARQIATDMGFQTKPIEEHLAAVKKAAGDGATVVAGFTPQAPPTVEAVRTGSAWLALTPRLRTTCSLSVGSATTSGSTADAFA